MKKLVTFLVNIFLCHFIYRVKYVNVNNVKKLDKCIICPNHSHILDPVWIYPKVNNLNIMAKSELFKNKLFAKFLKYFGAFPIKRGEKDAKSIVYAIKVLKNKEKSKLLIFPEGGILKEDKRRKFITNSAVYIAGKTNLPIVPVHITENPKKFSKIIIVFGEPINIEQELIKDKEYLEKASYDLLNKIYEMEER